MFYTIFLAIAFLLIPFVSPVSAQTTITIDPSTTYQTITGWEVTSQSGQEENAEFFNYRDTLFDKAVSDLGLTRMRVEVRAGIENDVDWWSKYRNGEIPNDLRDSTGSRICPSDSTPYWRYVRYSTVDDNDQTSIPGIPSNKSGRDPNSINWSRFHFAELDYKMEQVVLPFKQQVEASGQQFYFNLEYVGFHRQICSPYLFDVHTNPIEYAEFMLATVQHLKNKYNVVPNVIEPILEPDNTNYFNGTYIAQVIIETDKKLKANGFTGIKYIAPSNTSMANAITYYDAMIAEFNRQGVTPSSLIEEFVYHRYSGVSDSNLQAIASRASRDGVNTSMLEHINSGYQDLHKDLKLANNSSWQQYTLAFGNDPTSGGAYFSVPDVNNTSAPVELTTRAKYLRQYFKYVRPGAVRIGASGGGAFDPVAFINEDGRYAVVVNASGGGSFTIGNMPAGTYGITYTINSTTGYDVRLPDQTISSGQDISTNMPAVGVITIYGKTAGPTVAPTATPTRSPTPDPSNAPIVSVNTLSGTSQTIDLSGKEYYTSQNGVRGNESSTPVVIQDPVFQNLGGTASDTWIFTDGASQIDVGSKWLTTSTASSWSVALNGSGSPQTVSIYLNANHNQNNSMSYTISSGATTQTIIAPGGNNLYRIDVTFIDNTTVSMQPTGNLSWSAFTLGAVVVTSPPQTITPTSQQSPTISIAPGDTDGDGDVDIFDYNAVISHFGFSVVTRDEGDLDGDGDVDIFDYNLVISNFGQ